MRINYFPAGSTDFASSRLRVWKVATALRAMGHTVTFNSYNSSDCDVVVYQKVWPQDGSMKMFKAAGKRIIFDIDDLISTPIPAEVDQITVDTESKLAHFPGAVVIPDCLDTEPTSPRKKVHADNLNSAVWVGNTQNMYHLCYAARACRTLGINLTIITDLNNPHFSEQTDQLPKEGWNAQQWSADTVDQLMVEHDMAIFPFVFGSPQWSVNWVMTKSANRLLKAYGLGLPVVGTPIPSYQEIGLFWMAETTEQWCAALSSANDKTLRESDAELGWVAAQQFTADKVALKWIKVLAGFKP